ncbi:MAG: signal transduction histidine kinase/CheY-like chemotaxis protein [Oceanicoccus sp.]|jgi:signal transduction histidine kinase/CheY-like chemotaxis protein
MNSPSEENPTKPWSSWTISRRIIFSFMLLLIVNLSVTAYNIVGLNDIREQFKKFRQVSSNTNLMLKIDKNVSELQRYILIFSHTENKSTISQLNSLYQVLVADIRHLKNANSNENESQGKLLQQMQTGADQFGEKIERLKTERDYRDELVDVKLSTIFKSINDALASLFPIVGAQKNHENLEKLLQAQSKISNAEVFGGRYFTTHKSELAKEIVSRIDQAIQIIQTTQDLQKTDSFSSRMSQVNQLLTQSKKTFRKAVQADRNYLFLVNVVIAGESAELSMLADRLKSEFLQEQNELYSLTEIYIALIQKIAFYTALLAIFLAVVIAFITGRIISKPLQSITDTFGDLAKGKVITAVPGTTRTDEIGRLAKAANVFRETNAQTQVLLSQAEKVTEELEKAAIRAQEANVAKSQFLASMSHEIRTPMNGVIGMLHLLNKEPLSNQQKHYAHLAKSSADSLLILIDDILDMSKIEAGKLDIYVIEFDIHGVFTDLAAAMAPRIHDKGLEFILDIDDIRNTMVLGDPGRIRQILTNLLGNAFKFTQQGEIVLRASLNDIHGDPNNYQLCCDIIDTGIGIKNEKTGGLFQSFTQADSSTTRQHGGTGLGLSIVKQLCQLMGGDVTATSEFGRGSQFRFNIKLGCSESILDTAPSIDMTGIPMLIVDDNNTNIEVLSGLLRQKGIQVTACSSGSECLNVLEKSYRETGQCAFRIAILDMQMPNMDGAELAKLIRERPNNDHMDMIMMTSMDAPSDGQYYTKLGFSTYFHKPVIVQDLYSTLSRILTERETPSDAETNTTQQNRNVMPNSTTASTATKATENQLTQCAGKRILLVEDNVINQFVALGMLEDLGLSADVANNGLEAIQALVHCPPDTRYEFILMDCQMPELDGYETTRKIRKGDAGDDFTNVTIVAMTANAMQGDREKCIDAGMDDYLSKPIDEIPLTDCLVKWLWTPDESTDSKESTIANDETAH